MWLATTRAQVLLEPLLVLFVERLEDLVKGYIVAAHESGIVFGRRVAKVEVASLCLQRGDALTEEFAQPLFYSPQEGWLQAGGRWDVLAYYPELRLKVWLAKSGDLEIEMVGVPVDVSGESSSTFRATSRSVLTGGR